MQHLITYHQSIILEKNNPVVITILNFSTTASRKKPVSTFYRWFYYDADRKGKAFRSQTECFSGKLWYNSNCQGFGVFLPPQELPLRRPSARKSMIRAKPSRCTLTVGERRKRTWANPKKKTASGKPCSMPTTHAEKKKLKLTNKDISPPPPFTSFVLCLERQTSQISF